MLSLSALQTQILATLSHVTEVEQVPLVASLGRIAAHPISSKIALPVATVSAMDGFAFCGEPKAGTHLQLVGKTRAGKVWAGHLESGQCVQIMTGAVLPNGAEGVIMQEHTTLNTQNNTIQLNKDGKRGDNVRQAGEELRCGEIVLQKGQRIGQTDILLLASVGIAEVAVYRKIRVAVFSTGDELCEPHTPNLKAGQIYDSNRFLQMALLSELPVEVIDCGIMADCPAALETALSNAAQNTDVILTSGSVSVGAYDFLREVVARIGEIKQYRVKMKPGKPFVFGQIGKAVFFGLPGNPVSGFVGFNLLVKPALWQLAGMQRDSLPFLLGRAALSVGLQKKAGRREFLRAILSIDAQGNWQVAPLSQQDSHRVAGLAQANCLIDLPESATQLAAGETITVLPFFQRFLSGG